MTKANDPTALTPDKITTLFTRKDGTYAFARWGRPIVPVVFGVTEETLSVVKSAAEVVVALAGHKMAETDPELGANLMVFFLREWSELTDTKDLDRLVPDLGPLVARLQAADANQYRFFRFDPDGAIKACFVFIRMDAHLSDLPAETLALGQMVQSILLWSDSAFSEISPLAHIGTGPLILRPEIADIICAAYDPILPNAAQDPSHALRLFARTGHGS